MHNIYNRNYLKALILLLGLVFLQGCATVRSPSAVPPELIYKARVPNASNIRVVINYLNPESTIAQFKDAQYQLTKESLSKKDIYILAVSGGGADGAFGAGLLCGWTETGKRPQFDVVTGVSTGALIGPFAFLGPEYDHILKTTYTTSCDKDIFHKKSLMSLVFGRADALSSTRPLAEMLNDLITAEFLQKVAQEHAKGRRFFVATTQLDAQRPVIWNMGLIASIGTPKALELFRTVLLASAAIPVAFPPVHIQVEADGTQYDELHVDGGVSTQVFGYFFTPGTEITSHIYVIRNDKLANDPKEVELKLSSIATRSLSMLTTIQGVNDLIRIYNFSKDDYDDYNLAYIPQDFSAPRKGNFDPNYMKKLFEVGFEKAKSQQPWDKTPPIVNFDEIARQTVKGE